MPSDTPRNWPATRWLNPAEWVAGVVAFLLGLAHLLFLPDSGTDLAAQTARASFARSAPLTPVDLSWYGGVHPFGYSVLAPGLMAILGVAAAGLIAATVAAVLFARVLRGFSLPVITALLGAVFSVGNVVSGRTTFALSTVTLLLAVLLREQRKWAIVLAVLTALLSPVGAAFLGLIAAVLVLHRRPGGWTLGISASVPVLIVEVLFRGGGVQPFSAASALPAVVAAIVVAVITRTPMIRTGAVLYGMAVVLLAVHHDPFGSNILRLGLLVTAPVILASHRRPTFVAVIATIGMVGWQFGPLLADLNAGPGPEFTALTTELVSLHVARVEVVAPREHGESSAVAEQVPLARGWERQLDVRDNRLFYEGKLSASDFIDWLHRRAVDHVAVPRRGALDFGSTKERSLLSTPLPGLTKIWSNTDWTVYTVDSPRPIVDSPATVVKSRRTALTLFSKEPGSMHVVVRWSPWLSVTGPGCVSRDGDEVRVRFRSPGIVILTSSLAPTGHC